MRHTLTDPSRRGSALLAVVAMTMTIAMLSAILLQQSVSHMRRQSGAVDKKKALYLAEAGLAEGLHSLRAGNSGNIGDEDTPAAFGDGAFWVETREDANGLFLIEATGIAGGARATLETIVEPVLAPVSALGLVGFQGVTIRSGVTIAPYLSRLELLQVLADESGDAALADYLDGAVAAVDDLLDPLGGSDPDAPEVPFQLVVGSNGDIRVDGDLLSRTAIHGDLAPGPEATVELGLGVDVTGSTAPRTAKLVPPEVTPPELPLEAAFALPAGAALTVGPDARNFGAVRLGAGSTLRIVGPATLVTRMLDVRDHARIEIDPSGGPVEIYTVGGVKFGAGAALANLAEDPSGLSVYVQGAGGADIDKDGLADPAVTLPTTGAQYMQLVAPNAAVALPPSQLFCGSVAAGELTIGRGAVVRYDDALLAGNEQDAALEVVSWQVLQLPESVRTDLGGDLLARLRLANGGSLPRPAEVEQPVDYGVVYETPTGEERVYRGTAADFAAKDDGSEADEVAVVRRVLDALDPADRKLLRRERIRLAEVSK